MKSFILSQKCFMKHILLLLVFLAYGVSSQAYISWNPRGNIEVNGVEYQLYYKNVTSSFSWNAPKSEYLAYVTSFTGSNSEVVIPEAVIDGLTEYKVQGLRYSPSSGDVTTTLSSNSVTTIRFQGAIELNPKAGSPTFNCPNLQYIYFEGQSPVLSGAYGDYFQLPAAKSITVYLSDKTQGEIDALTQNSAVWCDFMRVAPISNANVKRNVSLSINHAKVEIRSDTYVSDASTQVDMYSDLTLKVYQGYDTYHVESVKLNGMEILGDMTFTQGSADYVSYYTYTLQNVMSDTYITVNGENTKYEVYAICNSGGTLDSPNSIAHPIDPNTKTAIRWFKADGNSSLTITPKAGYTLDNVYLNSERVTNDVTQNSDGTYTYALTGDAFISVVFKSAGENILFADPNVKALCVANWDKNSDGELSKAEAAAVTTLGTVFKNKTDITSFDEFQYFTGLTAVEADAFYNASLTSIVLPNTITEIKLRAFSRTRLTSIQFPEGLTTIGERAFDNAESLEYVKFPQSLEKIDYYAFQATAIRHIFIPQNVTYIGDETANPFSGCKKLVSIVVDERNGSFDSRDNCNAIIRSVGTATVVVGCQSTTLPKNAQTKTINLGMTSFNGLGLKKFVIPEHFGYFYQYALAGNDLDSLIIKKKEAFSYSPYYFSFSSQSAPNMLNTVVVVPYGMKAAYVAKGWVGEGDDGTQVVKQVVEAEPEGEEYVGEEFTLPVCTSRGGFTNVYYTQSNGDETSISINTSDGTVYEITEVKPGTDITFLLEPADGFSLGLVYCGYERLIGDSEYAEVTPLEDGRYRFVLRADQIKPGKTMPVFIYQKIGEDINFDLNNDSKIDIGDVTKLVNEVLKQSKP
ncbi:MAG: leucine-rich repeat domain-containing protein [Prevotella sp.]|nr:leucine-rich repeat domain-containing protein [Prevotella sp.]